MVGRPISGEVRNPQVVGDKLVPDRGQEVRGQGVDLNSPCPTVLGQ